MKKLLVLYSSVQSYVWGQLRAFVNHHPVAVELVHWPVPSDSPFVFSSEERLNVRSKSEFESGQALIHWALESKADAVLATGRMDKDYLRVVRRYKQKGIPTLTGIDNQWEGSTRQWFAVLFSYWVYRRYYSYMMPAGFYQWEYARRLGYRRQNLLKHCYSADVSIFHPVYERYHLAKRNQFPHRFLFVGRLVAVKAVDLLVESFCQLSREINHDWELVIVGNGPLKEQLPQHSQITYHDFMQPEALKELVADHGVFCLPSHWEPWGVVLHEFAAAGMPLVASWSVGAAASFLIPGLNGYQFTTGEANACKTALRKMIAQNDEQLWEMGRQSHLLSHRILPEHWAAEVFRLMED